MSDDLVERVALAIADAYYRSASSGQLTLQDTDTIPEDWEAEARAAIAVALEEAADAVGAIGDHADAGAYINAIRALIPQEDK